MINEWIDVAPGRQVMRLVSDRRDPARSDLAAPTIKQDAFATPVQCMADGKFYESKSAMAATHKAMGFTELGTHKGPIAERAKPDAAGRRSVIKKTLDRVGLDPHRVVEK